MNTPTHSITTPLARHSRKENHLFIRVFVFCITCLAASLEPIHQAKAGVIRSAVSVVVGPTLDEDSPASNLFDLEEFVTPFISGVTDYDTYLTENTAVGHVGTARWVSSGSGKTTGSMVFDLGDVYSIESFLFWNQGGNSNQAVIEFSVETSFDNILFSNVGSFNANPNLGVDVNATEGEHFDLSISLGRYVRWNVESNHGNPTVTAAKEVAFETSSVPTPDVLSLFGIGLIALIGKAFRRTITRTKQK